MSATRHVEPPRLGRSVLLQLLAIAAGALASEHPWSRKAAIPEPIPPPPHKEEHRIRVVRIEKPPPPMPKTAQTPTPTPPPKNTPATPAPKPPPVAAPPPPKMARAAPAKPQPQAEKPAQRIIAADSTSVQGVRMRVLVPREASELAAHLRNAGGCLVVSRLMGGSAEVVSVFGLSGVLAVERQGPPCDGVPRLLRDASLNAEMGDPLGRVRATHAGEDLVLQVLLSQHLPAAAQSALRAHFGPVSEEEMGRLAAESGYELTCFAEPSGHVRCQ